MGTVAQQVQENIHRLGNHVKRSIQENARALGQGKFTLAFTLLVSENKKMPDFIKDKIKGFNNVYTYVETDKAVFEWLYAKFRKLVVSE